MSVIALLTLTHSVNKQLGFGWEIVVDDIVQEGNINAPGLIMVTKQTNKSEHQAFDAVLCDQLTATSVTIITITFLFTNLAMLILRAVWSREL